MSMPNPHEGETSGTNPLSNDLPRHVSAAFETPQIGLSLTFRTTSGVTEDAPVFTWATIA